MFAAALASTPGCSKPPGGDTAGREMDAQRKETALDSDMKMQCIGRFQFEAPDALAVAGRTQSIYRTDVSTASMPPGEAQEAWKERLNAIRALAATDPVRRTFELEPGVPAVWYGNNPRVPSSVVLEAVRSMDDHLLKAVRRAEAGKESLAEKLVRNILGSYRPHETGIGFCIGFGSLTIEPAERESVSITLKHQTLAELEASIETVTVDRPDTESSSLDEAKAFAKSYGASMKVLRDRKRAAAGLTGHELCISLAVPNQPETMRFNWHYEGASGDAARPRIDIAGTARATRRAELEKAWDKVLDSLRPVPLSRR